MATSVRGPRNWSLERDEDGHRTYTITFLVRDDVPPGPDSLMAGPSVVLDTGGLPQPGDGWAFFGDSDLAAVCTHEAKVEPVERDEPYRFFEVTYTFTSKPKNFCQGGTRDDPLAYPPEISTKTVKARREEAEDAYGWPILSSSFEQIRGPAVEKERAITVVTVKVNLANEDEYNLPLYDRLLGCTNATEMWGLPIDTVLFSDWDSEKKYTAQCGVYWECRFEYQIDRKEGWAREVADEGLHCLRGRWVLQADQTYQYVLATKADGSPLDPRDPASYSEYVTPNGQQARCRLNGAGLPAGVIVSRTGLFCSIQNGNLDHAVTDRDWWLPIIGGYDVPLFRESGDVNIYPESYAPGRRYRVGFLTADAQNRTYIALVDEPTDGPPLIDQWLLVSSNPEVRAQEDPYSDATTYALGAIVNGAREETTQGYFKITLYKPVDLLGLLGDKVAPDDLNLAD